METNTLTFTARSSEVPGKIATFTLIDDHVTVNLGDAVMVQADEAVSEIRGEGEHPIRTATKPVLTGLIQQTLPDIHVRDVDARLDDDSLRLTTWIRVSDLRLLPATVTWEQVDNPDAARAFVDALRVRKTESAHPGRFRGLLDYWGVWLAAGAVAVALPWRWLTQRKADQEAPAAQSQ